jgi:DNA-binding beta-propeller fold protein YncE
LTRADAADDNGVSPQLAFGIVNTAEGMVAENVIFVTDDPAYNRVSLQIALTSGTTTLSPGGIPDPSAPDPGPGTTLYVDLSGLQLPVDVWNQLTFGSAGWEFKAFADQGVLGMTPAGEQIELVSGPGGAIQVEIGGLVVTSAPPSPQVLLYALYYGVPGVSGEYSSFSVAVQNASDQRADLAEVIGVSLSANGIVNTVVPDLTAANEFALQFFSKEKAVVKAGPGTSFTVGFAYGAPRDQYGYGALTDVDTATRFHVDKGDNAQRWVITPNRNAQDVSWTLQPPDGAPVVGSGAQAVVAVNFSNVVTTYQPGPTLMLVSYSGVPGYRDGCFTLVLNKIQHVVIESLTVSPNPTYFSGNSAEVTVGWRAAGAHSLELTQDYLTTPVTGKTEVPATLRAEATTFALRATGKPGTVDNSDFLTAQAIALPVINSFTGAPTEIYYGAKSHPATFDWAVDTAGDITLSSTAGAFDGQSFKPVGRASASITEAQMVTLAPETAANPLTLTRKLVISAFKPVPRGYPLAFTPSAVVASPSGPFVVAAGPSTSLTVLDTIRYQVSQTFALGQAASALAFSADGAVLAAANAGQTISVIGVTPGPTGMPVFGNPVTITVSGTPRELVFTPDGRRIFVTLDAGDDADGQVVSLLKSGDGYAIEGQPVTVGRQPRGLTLDAAGARLFVANFGESSVTMVGLTASGKLGGATTIDGFPGRPISVAATPDGRQLLVSCGSKNDAFAVVVTVDTDRLKLSGMILVGQVAGPIALLPSGAYAVVASGAGDVEAADGTVSLVDCWGPPDGNRLAGPPVPVGSRPAAVSVSPDGQQVLVAVDGGLSVVTLATYQASPDAPSIPNHPTSIAVSPDGDQVFAWHDAQVPARPSPGILVYGTRSRAVSNLLADKSVLGFAVSPDPRAAQGFAIVGGDPALYLISLETLEPAPITLGLPPGSRPVALAVSGEGQTLFVVAADASRQLTLVVLQLADTVWSPVQTLPLYPATTSGRILLRPTPDGTTVFLVDVTAAQVRVLRRSGAEYVLSPTVIPGDVSAQDLAVLPDGATAYVLNAGPATNTITVVDVASLNSHVDVIPQPYVNLTGLQPAPDGRRLFATDANAAAVRVLDPRSLRVVATIPLAAGPGPVAGSAGLVVTPDGSAIFTANTGSENLSIVEQVQLGTGPTLAPGRRPGSAEATYRGLFLRHYLGESPAEPSADALQSPDVIPFGRNIAPDRTIFTSPAGYLTDYGAPVTLGNPNYVYVRGRNPGDTVITSRVYLYYTRLSLAMWPANWQGDNITVNSEVRNWVDVTAPAGGVGVCDVPLVWTPPPLDPGADRYCLIAWVSDGPGPQPPDFASYPRFRWSDDLVRFIEAHHNLAWRVTAGIVASPPGYADNTALPMAGDGGSVYLQVLFKDVPPDGTFAVNLQGTDAGNSVMLPPSPLADYPAGYTPRNHPLVFPGGFSTSAQVQYWPGATETPPTAQIKVSLLVRGGALTATAGSSPGIVIRQALDETSPVFTNSPDLIVTGPEAAFDPSSLTDPDAYGWYFSRAPVPGSANYVYVRGVNDAPAGTQQSRVYLYYAASDQLLDPARWQSSGFTVGEAARNYVTLRAISQYQLVTANPPARWTPPGPASGGPTYFLISWTDDSADPVPPAWPTTPFADLAALGAYVRQHPAMAILDTVYRGAFLRQYPGQTVLNGGTGARTSPDVVVSGALAAPDAAAYTTANSYNSTALNATAALGVRNFIYLRAVNTVAGPAAARVYLYWATAADCSPPSWSATNFTFAGQDQNWVDLRAGTAGQIMVSTVPLVWLAPATATGPPVLIAYVDNSADPQPPDFRSFGYLSGKAVGQFVAGHPQLAWLEVVGQQVPTPTMTALMPLSADSGAGYYTVMVTFTDIPVGGTLSVSVPGADKDSTFVDGAMSNREPTQGVGRGMRYPGHFQTSAVLTYTATRVAGGSIVATMKPYPTAPVEKES